MKFICFPCAGGKAADYYPLSDCLPTIDVIAVELAGHGERLAEPAHAAMDPLIAHLQAERIPQLDAPFALFGHRMGAEIAYAFACRLPPLARTHLCPLFVSVFHSPAFLRHQPARAAEHPLTDERLIIILAQLGGSPRAVLTNSTLMQLFLPMLRADFSVIDRYRPQPYDPLTCPITAFAGDQEASVDPATMACWRRCTQADFVLHVFAGDHFFIRHNVAKMADVIARRLCLQPSSHHRQGCAP